MSSTEPEIAVTITDSEFTLGELQSFIDTAQAVDQMPANALVAITHQTGQGPTLYTVTASTAFRSKD